MRGDMDKINNPVAKFVALGGFDIPGRGRVICVRNDKERDRENDGLRGNIVEIDGIHFRVKGVESNAVTPIRKNAEIGLLIEEINNG